MSTSRSLRLTQGYEAIVDEVDYVLLRLWKWTAMVDRRELPPRVYAHRGESIGPKGKRRQWRVYLHRQIMGLAHNDPRRVDHVNGNTLDCRRSNLRIADDSQNAMNRRVRSDNVSGHTGVSWRANERKWFAELYVRRNRVFLGLYDSLEKAVEARKEAEREHFGEFARGYPKN